MDVLSDDPTRRADLVGGSHTLGSVTASVCGIVEQPRAPRAWRIAFVIASAGVALLLAMLAYLFLTGVGVWGLRIPAAWGFDITNFVFWVGIGHAGTLISAILFLCRQQWRTGINRFAEAMTIFAVICAGLFPAIHLGRPWLAYWLAPYPNQMGMWPNFASPLLWDFFAVGTYFTVSVLFWYLGMLPDLAALRDRARSRLRQFAYGVLALGWRGSARHWSVYEKTYLILAALATPLVLSVHSVVSFDFAAALIPGWHTTIFPPYFVAGAIFSGLAMVLTLAVPARAYFGLKDFITLRHLDKMARILLAMSLLVAYAYVLEAFCAWYSGNEYEGFAHLNRARGRLACAYWTMVFCNIAVPQLFWFRRFRISPKTLFCASILVNLGMWLERFVIIVTALSADFLVSSWREYVPSWVEVCTLIGSFGLFFWFFLLFCRYLPMVAMAEVKPLLSSHRAIEPSGHRAIGTSSQEPLGECGIGGLRQ